MASVLQRDDPRPEVEASAAAFGDVPVEAIVKAALLSRGLSFDPAARAALGEAKRKSYFIFSFDFATPDAGQPLPEEVRLSGGPYGLRPTIVSVRHNPESPWRVALDDHGSPILTAAGAPVADLELPPVPAYYGATTSAGKPIIDIAPTIQWGFLVYLAVFRSCQYFNTHEQCRFCDMNHNYREQKGRRDWYTGVKDVDEVVEAMVAIDAADPERETRAYTMTGGAVRSPIKGFDEADFYARYVEAIEAARPGRWLSKVVTQALPLDGVRRLKEAGTSIYHPNFEVWDPTLFEVFCPGKSRDIGRDEWLRRTVDAVEVFGPGRVVPNFVAGIEMARPHGFATPAEAVASTREGLDWFMTRDVTPRFTTWCPEPTTPLGVANPAGAPLEYHVRLLSAYRELLAEHGRGAPAGYGPPGAGRAVFSVSPLMDALDPAPDPTPVGA